MLARTGMGRRMPRLSAVAVAASLSVATARVTAATPASFDLVCQGAKGVQLAFRFDLAQRKWCLGECQSVWAIDLLSDSTIEFTAFTNASKSDVWTISINRYTSTFSAVHHGYGDQPADQGPCEPRPFSGFPVRKF